ncbi:MAG: hypothetical protein Q9195_006463 [Heterodermia aff. obscurata]
MSTKVRSSCDACHAAKVKCVKLDDHVCERCAVARKPCRFSPAIPRQRRCSSAQDATGPLTPASIISESWQSVYGVGVETPAKLNRIQGSDQDATPATDIFWPVAFSNHVNAMGPDVSPLDPYRAPSEIPSSDDSDFYHRAQTMPSARTASPARTQIQPVPNHHSSEMHPPTISLPSQKFSSSSPARRTSNPPYPQRLTQQPNHKHKLQPLTKASCQCLPTLLRATLDLHTRLSSTCSLSATLSGNSTALSTIASASSCPYACTASFPFLSSAFALLDLVLTSYAQSLRTYISTASKNADGQGEVGQAAVEVSIGDFSVSGKDQEFFVREIVFREVRRVEEEALAVLGEGVEGGGGGSGAVREHLAGMRMWLCGRAWGISGGGGGAWA